MEQQLLVVSVEVCQCFNNQYGCPMHTNFMLAWISVLHGANLYSQNMGEGMLYFNSIIYPK